jgi:hypothetical protein
MVCNLRAQCCRRFMFKVMCKILIWGNKASILVPANHYKHIPELSRTKRNGPSYSIDKLVKRREGILIGVEDSFYSACE